MIELVDELAVRRRASVDRGEFGGVDEAGRNIVQAAPTVHRLDPEGQAARIRRAVEGSLVDAIGLAGIAACIERQRAVAELQPLDVEEIVGASAGDGHVCRRGDLNAEVGARAVHHHGVEPGAAIERVVAGRGDEHVVAGGANRRRRPRLGAIERLDAGDIAASQAVEAGDHRIHDRGRIVGMIEADRMADLMQRDGKEIGLVVGGIIAVRRPAFRRVEPHLRLGDRKIRRIPAGRPRILRLPDRAEGAVDRVPAEPQLRLGAVGDFHEADIGDRLPGGERGADQALIGRIGDRRVELVAIRAAGQRKAPLHRAAALAEEARAPLSLFQDITNHGGSFFWKTAPLSDSG